VKKPLLPCAFSWCIAPRQTVAATSSRVDVITVQPVEKSRATPNPETRVESRAQDLKIATGPKFVTDRMTGTDLMVETALRARSDKIEEQRHSKKEWVIARLAHGIELAF